MAEIDIVPPDAPQQSTTRKILNWVLKLGLLAGIFAWLIYKKSIKASDLQDLAKSWHWAALALALYFVTMFICAFRYKLLLRALDFHVRYWDVVCVSMIGSFYDLASPVSSGGDLVKAYYINRSSSSSKGEKNPGLILFSVLLDRILGMFGLFTLGLLVIVLGWNQISGNENLRRMALFVALVCAGCLCGFFLMVSEKLEQSPLRKRLMGILPFHEKIEKIYAGFAGLRHHKKLLAAMAGLSVLNHTMVCSVIFVLAQGMTFTSVATGQEVPLPTVPCLTVLPLGIFLNTFGVAGGFGVGNLAFEQLFTNILGITGGARLICSYQIVGLLFRLSGAPFVLLYKSRARQ